MPIFELKCKAQNYAWGKIGDNSEVAKLMNSSGVLEQVADSEPYAELWMGTHVKAPSVVAETDELLTDWIKANPVSLGESINTLFPVADDLPFLFKVLSVNKALSIQAHPNKEHAVKLHALDPKNYPDPNHKPEMAIALTPFEGLCGFKPKTEILEHLLSYPELSSVFYDEFSQDLTEATSSDAIKTALQKALGALLSRSSDDVTKIQEQLMKRFSYDQSDIPIGKLFTRLCGQFPGDVGCFCSFLLNHMKLAPGEAMFLEANLPHAYLSGDCMECMACSDNVVRAGLTPKFKDVQTLIGMLDYRCRSAAENIFSPVTLEGDAAVTRYNPPVDDFCVDRIVLEPGSTTYTMCAVPSASIVLVVEGKFEANLNNDVMSDTRRHLSTRRGHVLFIPANENVQLSIITQKVLMFRAFVHK